MARYLYVLSFITIYGVVCLSALGDSRNPLERNGVVQGEGTFINKEESQVIVLPSQRQSQDNAVEREWNIYGYAIPREQMPTGRQTSQGEDLETASIREDDGRIFLEGGGRERMRKHMDFRFGQPGGCHHHGMPFNSIREDGHEQEGHHPHPHPDRLPSHVHHHHRHSQNEEEESSRTFPSRLQPRSTRSHPHENEKFWFQGLERDGVFNPGFPKEKGEGRRERHEEEENGRRVPLKTQMDMEIELLDRKIFRRY